MGNLLKSLRLTYIMVLSDVLIPNMTIILLPDRVLFMRCSLFLFSIENTWALTRQKGENREHAYLCNESGKWSHQSKDPHETRP